MSLKMTKSEREAFLAEVHVGVISIADPAAAPLTVPIWYGYEPGGDVWCTTDADSRKGRLISLGTRISLCAQTEENPYQYVSVEGPIVAVEPADVERDERPLAHRYLGEAGGDHFLEADKERREATETIRFAMRPERWLTVDYRKEDVGL